VTQRLADAEVQLLGTRPRLHPADVMAGAHERGRAGLRSPAAPCRTRHIDEISLVVRGCLRPRDPVQLQLRDVAHGSVDLVDLSDG
jgi:hypothetical protein